MALVLGNFVGKRMSKNVKFMGEDLTINKLSVSEVLNIQEAAKAINQDESKGFEVLKTVIKASAEGGDKITDEEFDDFPMDELNKLSNEIMKFSGIDTGEQKGK